MLQISQIIYKAGPVIDLTAIVAQFDPELSVLGTHTLSNISYPNVQICLKQTRV